MSRFAGTGAPRSFTCGRCSDPFPTFEALQRHVDKLNHFRCTSRGCQKNFDSRAEFTAHRQSCRSSSSLSSQQRRPPLIAISDSQIHPMSSAVLEDAAHRRERVLRAAARPGAYTAADKPRFVFMDTDNIIFSMLNSPHLHTLVPGAKFSNALRLHFDKFTQRVCNSPNGSRSPHVKMLRASYHGAADVLAQSLIRFGWGIAKREPAWDQGLEQQLLQQKSLPASPSTLVLVTGDGNVNKSGDSFRSIAEKFLKLGWCVEIHAWAHSVHEGFLRLMEDHPSKVLVKLIDETENLSELVFAGKYNPVVAAVPSPRFQSQPPSPVHSPLGSTTSEYSPSGYRHFSFDDDDVLVMKHMPSKAKPESQDERRVRLDKQDNFNNHASAFTCKLSGKSLTDPVLLSCCGETINRSAYATVNKCPFCQSVKHSITPNKAIQDIQRAMTVQPLR